MSGYYRDELVTIEGEWLISSRDAQVENLEILGQGKIGDFFCAFGGALNVINDGETAERFFVLICTIPFAEGDGVSI